MRSLLPILAVLLTTLARPATADEPPYPARTFDCTVPVKVRVQFEHGGAQAGETPATDLGGLRLPACEMWTITPLVTLEGEAWIRLVREIRERRVPALRLSRWNRVGAEDLGRLAGSGLVSLSVDGGGITAADLAAVAKLRGLRKLLLGRLSDGLRARDLGVLTGLESLESLTLNLTAAQIGPGLGKLIAALPKLTHLNVWSPERMDAALPWIAKAPNLTRVGIGRVEDPALAHLAGLEKLTWLTISPAPRFTGEGLAKLSRLSLRRLELRGAQEVAGPGLRAIGTLRDLESLDLTRCAKLTGLALRHLAPLKRMRILRLDGCPALTSDGLDAVKSMPALEMLTANTWTYQPGVKDIAWLTDDGMAHLRGLKQLRYLDLMGQNRITDVGLAHLASLTSLKHLILNRVKGITEDGMATLSKLTQLRTLDIDSCEGIGELDWVVGMTQLRRLELGWCEQLADADLVHLKPLKQLETLDIGHTSITAVGCAALAGLDRLRSLDLGWCKRLDDTAMAALAKLRSLEDLDVHDSKITDAGLAKLAALPRLTRLDISFCKGIQGDALTQLTHLREVDLGYCDQVTEETVAKLGTLPHLTSMSLGGKELVTGAKLIGLARSKTLRRLDLVYCKHLSDAGLRTIGGLSSVRNLELGHNPQITDAGLEALAAANSRLNQLGIYGCPGISDRGIGALAKMKTLRKITVKPEGGITRFGLARFRAEGATTRLPDWLDPTRPDQFPELVSKSVVARRAAAGAFTEHGAPALAILSQLFRTPAGQKSRATEPTAAERQRIAALVIALDDRRYPVREKASAALVTLGWSAIRTLRGIATSEGSPERQRRARAAVAAIDPIPPALPVPKLVSAPRDKPADPRATDRASAALALAMLGDERHVDGLRAAMLEGHGELSTAAAFALRAILGQGPSDEMPMDESQWRHDRDKPLRAWCNLLYEPVTYPKGPALTLALPAADGVPGTLAFALPRGPHTPGRRRRLSPAQAAKVADWLGRDPAPTHEAWLLRAGRVVDLGPRGERRRFGLAFASAARVQTPGVPDKSRCRDRRLLGWVETSGDGRRLIAWRLWADRGAGSYELVAGGKPRKSGD